MRAERIVLKEKPYQIDPGDTSIPWAIRKLWDASFVTVPGSGQESAVYAFRLRFEMPQAERVRFHVTADERYELYIDGELAGRGSERGDMDNWYYETYEADLSEGEHVITARVWYFGALRPWAQMGIYPAFLFSPQEKKHMQRMATGIAPWECIRLPGYGFVDAVQAFGVGTGAKLVIDGTKYLWDWNSTSCTAQWQPAEAVEQGYETCNYDFREKVRVLVPGRLPAAYQGWVDHVTVRLADHGENDSFSAAANCTSMADAFQAMLDGEKAVTVGAGETVRVLFDLNDYNCVYPYLRVSGGKGAQIRLGWQEGLYDKHNQKGVRSDIEGKRWFNSESDVFLPDGGEGRVFDTLWWHAGKYALLEVTTGDQPVTLEGLTLEETRFDWQRGDLLLESSDQRMNALVPVLLRSVQMCTHETFMDCPFYEQLMYLGDTRTQALVAYTAFSNSELMRKAVEIFRGSVHSNSTHLLNCAYPQTGGKLIPSFNFWWVGMVYDYALWRGEKEFIRSLMPSVRFIMDSLLAQRDENGLVVNPEGWNYIDDGSSGYSAGIPEDNGRMVNCPYNLVAVLSLRYLMQLEEYVGEPLLAQRADDMSRSLMRQVDKVFWDHEKNAYADDYAHSIYSEHSLNLAVLTQLLDDEMLAKVAKTLASDLSFAHNRPSMFFSHYQLSSYAAIGRPDLAMKQLEKWYGLLDMGFHTTPETFSEYTRSDCHAWGAHPYYYLCTGIAGVRPAKMGFEEIEVHPQLGDLQFIHVRLPHPKGEIEVYADQSGKIEVQAPQGVKYTIVRD